MVGTCPAEIKHLPLPRRHPSTPQFGDLVMSKLEGKVAVVTGASKGIGASIALHLAAEGAAVVVNYASSKQGADRVVGEITAKGGRAVAVQADVAKQADIRRLFAETVEGVRPARRPRQQRRGLRVHAARGGDAGALPQALRPQRAGPDPDDAGGGPALRPGRRERHQHQLGGQHLRRCRTPRSTAPPRRPWTP